MLLSTSVIRFNELGFENFPRIGLVTCHKHLLHLIHLSFEVGDALLELEALLGFGLLGHGVLDHLDTLGVVQRVFHLTLVVDRRRAVDEHERLRCATEGVFHQLSQHVVTVGDKLSIFRKGLDDVS